MDCPHGSALEYYWLECLPAHAVSVSSLVSYMCAMRRPPIRGQFMTANDCTRYCYACNRRLVNHLHRGCLTVVLRNCTRVSKELSFLITCSFNDFNNESCDRYSLCFSMDDHTHWQRWVCTNTNSYWRVTERTITTVFTKLKFMLGCTYIGAHEYPWPRPWLNCIELDTFGYTPMPFLSIGSRCFCSSQMLFRKICLIVQLSE